MRNATNTLRRKFASGDTDGGRSRWRSPYQYVELVYTAEKIKPRPRRAARTPAPSKRDQSERGGAGFFFHDEVRLPRDHCGTALPAFGFVERDIGIA